MDLESVSLHMLRDGGRGLLNGLPRLLLKDHPRLLLLNHDSINKSSIHINRIATEDSVCGAR